MSRPRYDSRGLREALTRIDEALAVDVEITVIGGSALALGYDLDVHTTDIDTYRTRKEHMTALAAARTVAGITVPIGDSSVAQLPEGAETRLRRVLTELAFLRIHVIDVYDLAASKLLRGLPHDRQQLGAYHARHTLDRATLIERCRSLLDDHVGDTREPRWMLYHFVRDQWGELAALDLRPA